MIRWVLALCLAAGPAWACPEPTDAILAHTCWTDAKVELLLLPDQADSLAAPEGSVLVTGGYTGVGQRDQGGPMPVGLFVHNGTIINRNMARMDGVLLLRPGHAPRIVHRQAVQLDGAIYDLTDIPARGRFLNQARTLGLSVVQSHLVIVEGRVDVRPRKVAQKAVRRFLMQDQAGLALVQTPKPMTLFAAADWLRSGHMVRMALNLDMGAYDFCMRIQPGAAKNCGRVTLNGIAILSNLLRFKAKAGG